MLHLPQRFCRPQQNRSYKNAANFSSGKEPEFYSDRTEFVVIFPNLNFGTRLAEELNEESAEKSAESAEKSADSQEPLTKRQIEILGKMEVGREYSADEIADMIGLKAPRARQLLVQLTDMDKIRMTAVTKNRRYIKVISKKS